MPEPEPTREAIIVRYVTMPDELEAALAGLPEADLDLARTSDAWTIRQIVHHVVDADDATKMIIKAALGNSGCIYELGWYDPNNIWAKTLDYASQPIPPALALLRANHRYFRLLTYSQSAWR
jgi:hypothetical protein